MKAATLRRLALVLAIAAAGALALPGCAGCENSVCCAVPGHALPTILRPSGCTQMGGTAVAVAMCDVICCEASPGTFSASPRTTCTRVVEARLCDVPDGG